MAVVPLYEPHVRDPELPRNMRSPGGYDWWRLQALSDDGVWHLSIAFFDGNPLDGEYVEQYVAYRRRPTVATPPVPRPAFRLTLWREFSRQINLAEQGEPDRPIAIASSNQPIVRVGEHALSRRQDGASWEVNVCGSDQGRRCHGSFRFIGSAAPFETPIGDPLIFRSVHQWNTIAAACRVDGELALDEQTFRFSGRGSYVRRFGTAPLGVFAACWQWGIAVAGDRVATWELVQSAATGNTCLVAVESSTSDGSAAGAEAIVVDGKISLGDPRVNAFAGMKIIPLAGSAVSEESVWHLFAGTWDGAPLHAREAVDLTRNVRALYAPSSQIVKH